MLRSLSAIVGEEALSDIDRKYLKIANNFERKFVNQGVDENRSIEETLNIGWDLLSEIPESELKRIKPEFIAKYRTVIESRRRRRGINKRMSLSSNIRPTRLEYIRTKRRILLRKKA